jgi:hypothetical protein
MRKRKRQIKSFGGVTENDPGPRRRVRVKLSVFPTLVLRPKPRVRV